MIHTLTLKAIAVWVPKGVYKHEIFYKCVVTRDGIGASVYSDNLPPGSWSILGKGNELTEDQCKGIVEEVVDNKFQVKYRDYWQKEPTKYKWEKELKKMGFINALSSFESLLKSKNINPDSVIILIKKQ